MAPRGNDVHTLLAQAADPLSGGAGWVGAGLLGCVLAWLMFLYLPAKDKQLKELVDNKDKLLIDITTAKDDLLFKLKEANRVQLESHIAKKDAAVEKIVEEHAKTVDKVVAYCAKETSNVVAALQDVAQRIDDMILLKRAPV